MKLNTELNKSIKQKRSINQITRLIFIIVWYLIARIASHTYINYICIFTNGPASQAGSRSTIRTDQRYRQTYMKYSLLKSIQIDIMRKTRQVKRRDEKKREKKSQTRREFFYIAFYSVTCVFMASCGTTIE